MSTWCLVGPEGTSRFDPHTFGLLASGSSTTWKIALVAMFPVRPTSATSDLIESIRLDLVALDAETKYLMQFPAQFRDRVVRDRVSLHRGVFVNRPSSGPVAAKNDRRPAIGGDAGRYGVDDANTADLPARPRRHRADGQDRVARRRGLRGTGADGDDALWPATGGGR